MPRVITDSVSKIPLYKVIVTASYLQLSTLAPTRTGFTPTQTGSVSPCGFRIAMTDWFESDPDGTIH